MRYIRKIEIGGDKTQKATKKKTYYNITINVCDLVLLVADFAIHSHLLIMLYMLPTTFTSMYGNSMLLLLLLPK